MKLLNLDDAEVNLLAWLVQCCLSDGLLLKSGLPPDVAEKYLAEVRTLDAKLMEIAVRSGERQEPVCGEQIISVGAFNRNCTRPRGHAGSHIWEARTGP